MSDFKTIAIPREDGDYDIVATLNNDGQPMEGDFEKFAQKIFEQFNEAYGGDLEMFDRQDASDCFSPDDED